MGETVDATVKQIAAVITVSLKVFKIIRI